MARVLLTGPVPTPAVAHITKSMACDAGIMLTASHNPYADNGIKIFGPDGYKLNDSLETEVEAIIKGEDLSPNKDVRLGKAFRIDDAKGRYIEFAKSSIGSMNFRGLKVVVDSAHGAGYYVGRSDIAGRPCEHLAFRLPEVDVQLWIEEGDRPLIARIVITHKLDEGNPQFRATLHDWDLAPETPETLFYFEPEEGKERLLVESIPAERRSAREETE